MLPDIDAFQAWRADAVAMAAGRARHRAQSRIAAWPIRIRSPPAPISSSGSTTDLILKIFPPMLRAQFVSERASLRRCADGSALPIPRNRASKANATDGRISSSRACTAFSAREAWPGVAGGSERTRAAARSARPSRKCSGSRSANCPRSNRAGISSSAGRSTGCRARHDAPRIAAQNFSTGLDEFLGRSDHRSIPMDAPPVILTGEYIPENFLLSHEARRLAAVGADRFRRRADRLGRIRSAWPERLHDGRHAAPGPQPVRRIRLFDRRHRLRR